jgi:hypothetical protein
MNFLTVRAASFPCLTAAAFTQAHLWSERLMAVLGWQAGHQHGPDTMTATTLLSRQPSSSRKHMIAIIGIE